jgi:solute carrier family 25 protein 34/35
MYNQPTVTLPGGKIVGTRYKNPIDCLWKTITTEGPFALYKGNDLRTF